MTRIIAHTLGNPLYVQSNEEEEDLAKSPSSINKINTKQPNEFTSMFIMMYHVVLRIKMTEIKIEIEGKSNR